MRGIVLLNCFKIRKEGGKTVNFAAFDLFSR